MKRGQCRISCVVADGYFIMPKQSKTQKKKKNGKNNGTKKVVPIAVGYAAPRNRFRVNGKGQFTLQHSEMVDVFVGSASFAQGLIGYRINAGNTNLFPWLGSIAPAFEKYCFRRLQFRWVPHCPATSAGVVSMAVDYDAADEVPADRSTMMAYKTRVTSPPYAECSMVCDAVDLKSTMVDRYVLTASFISPEAVVYPMNVDRRMYDLGYVYISVESNFAESCGDLWVDYIVDLKQPDFVRSTASSCVVHAHSNAGVSKNDPLGTIVWDWVGDSFSGIVKTVANNMSLLKIPKGVRSFLAETFFAGSGLANATVKGKLTDSLGAERKEYGSVTPALYTGDGTSWQTQYDVSINEVPEDVFFAIDTTAATSVTGLFGMYMYPKPPF